jgi:ADP-ribose pyrophosphatase YjhB (NUDIX family)
MAGIEMVVAVVFIRDYKVLLLTHGKDGIWKFPGGGIETPFETTVFLDVAMAKVKKELGVGMETRQHPFPVYSIIDGLGGRKELIILHFLAHLIGDIKPGEGITDHIWFPIDELWKVHKGPNVETAIEHFGFIKPN